MAVANILKSLRDIMRQDKGVSGDAQRLEQMSWLFFLKVYDAQEEIWESDDDDWMSVIPEQYRWRNWAKSKDQSGKSIQSATGGSLIKLVNNMISYFKPAENDADDDSTAKNDTANNAEPSSDKPHKIQPTGDWRKDIIIDVFRDVNNYMKDGGLLRQVVDVIHEIDLSDAEERHSFGDMYEKMLQEMQAAGAAGEFYTPRAVTSFIIDHLNPKLGELVADYACGTGGFLSSALEFLAKQKHNADDEKLYQKSVYGQEWKALPYVLCITNLLLKDLNAPNIKNVDSLTFKKIDDITDDDKADVIAMNPPYGGVSSNSAKENLDCQSSETADLFIKLITEMLAENGRAGVIIPDGFLFGDGAKKDLKESLLRKFNLHTVIRLPKSVFAPYTSIATNILFFDNATAKGAPQGFRTKETWFYRLDMPEGYKNFSKTKYMRREHLAPADLWWNDRKEIIIGDGDIKAKCFSAEEIAADNFNLDKCKYPQEVETILPPDELLSSYHAERERLNAEIDRQLAEIQGVLQDEEPTNKDSNFVCKESLIALQTRLSLLESTLGERLWKSVLQEAISGRLTTQQPSDGTADDLLEQIKAAHREAFATTQKKYKPLTFSPIPDSEIPFDIPENWKWVRLGEIVNLFPTEEKQINDDSWILDLEDIEKDTGVILQKKKYKDIQSKSEKKTFVKGNVLYSKLRPYLNKVVLPDEDGFCTSELVVLDFGMINNKYAHSVMMSSYVVNYSMDDAYGVKMPRANMKKLWNLPFPLPPLSEQLRIVTKLEKLRSALDKRG